jgi:hypothetical protein
LASIFIFDKKGSVKMLMKLLDVLMKNVFRFCGLFFLVSAITVLLGLALQLNLTQSLNATVSAWGSLLTAISHANPILIAVALILLIVTALGHLWLMLKKRNNKI